MVDACHLCGAQALDVIGGPSVWGRVTSDVQPWAPGKTLAVCRACGTVQTIATPAWSAEADRIYAQYAIYHQADGAEQSVFNQASGAAMSRSRRLLDRLSTQIDFPAEGRMLDVGCGNGGMLRAMLACRPEWRAIGADRSSAYGAEIDAIAPNCQFHNGELSAIDGVFDLVTLVHVLEHVVDPRGVLAAVREKLSPDGRLLIQAPNFPRNPFDLAIADHCTHFTETTLPPLLESAGFEIELVRSDLAPRELTAVARPGAFAAPAATVDWRREADRLNAARRWLEDFLDHARAAVAGRAFGVFGSSIGAVWLDHNLDRTSAFFVDEDPLRVGRRLFGRPILHPQEVDRAQPVVMALAPDIAQSVLHRLAPLNLQYVEPPAGIDVASTA